MTINIAIIPARLGSKRIKNKNIKKFYNKPIIQWTFEILKKSKVFSHIIVSTESHKIINICKKIGIEDFVIRPLKLSGDFIGIQKVIEHSIIELEKPPIIRRIMIVIRYVIICFLFLYNSL